MSLPESKPFLISKHSVLEAWKRVKANQGAAGIDEESIQDFEHKLKDNLYRIWNRMSSGSYLPPPVKTVAIPKTGGGERKLGIPTVADRVAQMVVKMHLEPKVEPLFHPDSYGYRPFKSAHDAVGQARKRCWKYDWVLDLDIKGFFDNIPHELLMRAVRKHAPEKWVVLYVERWLKAPAQNEQGQLTTREKGTPQGGVVSPLLANLFLHYGFDAWMARKYPSIPFERYADDAIVHCRTKKEAESLREAIILRMAECGLELNLQKTKIVYCQDADRRGTHEHEKFTFLGYEFRPRRARNHRGKYFVSFLPAISDKAAKAIREEIRGWKLQLRSDKSLEDLARMFNPILRGWMQYYGKYYRSMLHPVFRPLNRRLVRWACRKYKKLRDHQRRATHWLRRISIRSAQLWAHWQIGVKVAI
ncbi:MAG TPA: group II intron reverse transcriptase/maturase [Candidatus Acidoferrum sp.]|nr:group II intron reverse transcriptase/maturase [Candidatus Acidoferrum sp.]